MTVHRLHPATSPASWSAYPDLNCVIAHRTSSIAGRVGVVDLTTAERYVLGEGWHTSDRLIAAVKRLMSPAAPPPPLALPVRTAPPSVTDPNGVGPYLRLRGTAFEVPGADPAWPPFEPLRDGRPLLGGTDVVRAQLAGNVLALALRRGGERNLVFFHGPVGRVLGEVPHPHSSAPFALSPCGRRVARVKPSRTVVVADVPGTGPALAAAAPAGVHNNLVVRVDANPFRLLVRVGGFAHQFAVQHGELFHMVVTHAAAHPTWPPPQRPAGAAALYDPARFPTSEAVTAGPWTAVPDRLGQVLLFAAGPGLVLSVLVRRELAAVWAPGGVFGGSTALIGGPPTRDATRVIGVAIDAVERG